MKHKLHSRVLTALLSLLLIIGMIPTVIFASETVAPTTVQVNGTEILNKENHTVSCGSGTATYDSATNTLTLDNVEINYRKDADSNSKAAILFDGDLNINLVGENTITSVTCGILGKNAGTLTITGDSLTLDCIYYGIGRYSPNANITIDGANIDITAKGTGNFTGVGIQAGGVLSIKNGAYIDATDVSHHPIIGNAGIEISDSTLYAQQYTDYYVAIRSESEISISNSIVEAKADSADSFAIWAGNDLSSPQTPGNITISNGSDVTLYSKNSNAVYAMLGTISISDSTVKAESGALPALCAYGDIDITDHSSVTANSAGSIGIWSSGGAIEIQNSTAKVTANDEWDAIRGQSGGVTISGSWVETFGSMVSPKYTSSDSAVFLNNKGTVSDSLTLPGSVTVSENMKLSIPEDSSITVPNGVTFTNHGSIEVVGSIVKEDGGTIVCDSHSYQNGVCTICGVADPDYVPPAPVYIYYDINASAGEGGIITPDGTSRVLRGTDKTFTITPDSDYVVSDVLVDGKSVGAVTSYTFETVREDHSIQAIFELSEEAQEAIRNEKLKEGVRNTTIRLRSTLGNGFIRLDWEKSAGYKVDCYEVYKSTKRYSGYGTEPYFETKQGGLTGWYKNTKELKKGVRYYYKVRGVREIAGETVYTKWSTKAWRLVK